MIRTNLLVACASALVLTAGVRGNEDEQKTNSAGPPRVQSNVGFSTNKSNDGQVVTVIFDNLFQDVERTRKGAMATLNQTNSHSKVVTLQFPYSTDQKSVKLNLDLRGYAAVDPDANVKLIALVGDTATVVDVFETAKGAEPVKLKGKSKENILATTEPIEGKAGDFMKRIEFVLEPRAMKPVCQITLVLVAEHDTDTPDSGGGLVIIDSLDFSFSGADHAQAK